jgi:hypothetical protein
VVIGVMSENTDFYSKLANELMKSNYQVVNPVAVPGFKNLDIYKHNIIYKCALCQALILDPDDPYGVNQEVINHGILNNQIIVLDHMAKVEDTLEHIKKEITNA